MDIILVLIFITAFKSYHCQDIKDIFEKINKETERFNAIAADITWESSVKPYNPKLVYRSNILQKENIEWTQKTCDGLERMKIHHLFDKSQIRQIYLLCRGPKYTYEEARLITDLYQELQSIYTEAEVCIPTEEYNPTTNLTEVETTILKYLKSADNFYKQMYHWSDSTMFAVKNALTDVEGDDKYTLSNIRRDVKNTIKYIEEDDENVVKDIDGDKNALRNTEGIKNVLCLKGEEDSQKVMEFSRNEEVLKWAWLVWRETVGPPMKEPYGKLVVVENVAARRNGYSDIGASWREELEIPNLRETCRRLYDEVKPLYSLLHGVVRFYLRKKYGDVVPETGAIPAHLLGDLWSQNWEPLADLIIPRTIDLDESITNLNWTVHHMVKRAEDFYQSLGLPPMTESFWKKSVFMKESIDTRCHGSAADMFNKGDFRLLYCSGRTKEDFYVFHHELGHIQYYMAYEHQPTLFRQANMALHEAIGDTIMYGVMTPQHLHRLGLINDSLLYNTNTLTKENDTDHVIHFSSRNNYNQLIDIGKNTEDKETNVEGNSNEDLNISTDDILLLKQALNKIPQIPFSLLIDEYRWKYFKGDFTTLDLNRRFWQMSIELQGIAPPIKRGVYEFDVGAKYHVPDNTPYIRYFLSSFLQNQLFESLCKAAVFGHRGVRDPLPDTITMNRCDIYGSKAAGKLLMDIMSRGHSQHWRQILQETTGQDDISTGPLLRYYRPLHSVLEKLVRTHRIPIGW